MKETSIQEERVGPDKKRWDYKGLYVEHSSKADVLHVERHLRKADRDEISASTDQCPLRVLEDGVSTSIPCFTIKITSTGKPCGIFGVRESDHPNVGVVWMCGTDDLLAHSFTFLRHSRKWLKKLHESYDLLYNVIDARNKLHVAWLNWLEFDFVQEFPKYGVQRRKFIMFIRYDGNRTYTNISL